MSLLLSPHQCHYGMEVVVGGIEPLTCTWHVSKLGPTNLDTKSPSHIYINYGEKLASLDFRD